MPDQSKTIHIDNEGVDLKQRISYILKEQEAKRINDSWGVAGSIEFTNFEIMIWDSVVSLVSYSDGGYTITGPAQVVDRLQKLILTETSLS